MKANYRFTGGDLNDIFPLKKLQTINAVLKNNRRIIKLRISQYLNCEP